MLNVVDGNILIREARPEEIEAVEALVKTAYGEFQSLFPDKMWLGWMNNISKVIHGETGILLAAADSQGTIHGAVKFYPDAAQASLGIWPQGAASMRILAVHPASRGRGIGRMLVEECLRRARQMAVPEIYLYTGPFMTAARRLYEQIGFTRAPEFDKDPGPIAYHLKLAE
ncbi:MAG: GNAT family N-acetyltransferase [Deltaproteobacteria bacterium]|nr:GNAT family N-acetyltransferase [Deltaproteobacteria bacterium]